MKMEDYYPYPVFLECSNVLSEQNKKKIENYFKIKRKSGGGECGPVTTAADETYSIAFKHQRDQQEVLRRCEHTVELPSGPLVFIVTDKPVSFDSSSTSVSTAPVERAVSNENSCINTGNRSPPDDQQEALKRSKHVAELTDGRLVFSVRPNLSPPSSSHDTTAAAPAEIFKCVQEDMKYNRFTENDHDSSPTRIVLLGKTGAGKSHLANTILGEELFTLYHSANAGTHTCQSETRTVSGRSLTLIDTPGFFDTDKSEEELKPEIMSCLTECAPGPHIFLILLKVDRFTKQEQQLITEICDHFSGDALKYAVIVFTHGEQLKEGMKIEEFVSQNEDLSNLVKKCGGRCHVFDNKHWSGDRQDGYRNNQVQLEVFLQTVDRMMVEKNGSYYTNDVLRHVEERIQKQEKQISREMAVYLPPQEIRKQAKTLVSNEFLIQLAGTATGVLLGAFFEVEKLLEVVMKVVNTGQVMSHVKSLESMAPALVINKELVVAGGAIAGVAVLGAAAVGGIRGGAIGCEACKEAKTPMEAIERSYEAVMKERRRFRKLPQN